MKSKYQSGRQVNDVLDSSLGKKRMDEYLKATQASFEAAVVRANTLGQAASGREGRGSMILVRYRLLSDFQLLVALAL